MKNGFSLASFLGRNAHASRLPDLGMRELNVLETLWRKGPLTSQGALKQMLSAGITLSTVQSTLERLNRKQLVSREKQGRSFVYTATLSKENIISGIMRDLAESLTDGDTAPMVSGFLDYLDSEKPAASQVILAARRKR